MTTPTTDRPPPGSAWADHCPDAYPAEWYDALGLSALPPGFVRFATDAEADLITGRTTADEFRARTGRPAAPGSPGGTPGTGPPCRRTRGRGDGRRAAVRQRFRDLSSFLRDHHPGLTPTERAVWLAVFAFSEDGRATVTQRALARVGGVSDRAVRAAVRGLVRRGLLDVLVRGGPGRASTYRYRVA